MGVSKDTSKAVISNFTANNYYVECELELDSLRLKYKECFNKSLPLSCFKLKLLLFE